MPNMLSVNKDKGNECEFCKSLVADYYLTHLLLQMCNPVSNFLSNESICNLFICDWNTVTFFVS